MTLGRKDKHYTDSVISGKGNLLAVGGSQSNSTPGPGHYNTYTEVMPLKRSPRALDPEQSYKSSPQGRIASGSPRVLHPSSSLKGDIVFHGKHEDHKTIGPGHYYNAMSDQHLTRKVSTFALEMEIARRRDQAAQGGVDQAVLTMTALL